MHEHAEGDDVTASQAFHETAIRIDTSVALNATLKVLGLLAALLWGALLFFGPGWLDTRIVAVVTPVVNQSLEPVKGQLDGVEKKVDQASRKDGLDDVEAAQMKQRMATLEQLAINGRAERMQQFKDLNAKVDGITDRAQLQAVQLGVIQAILERMERAKNARP